MTVCYCLQMKHSKKELKTLNILKRNAKKQSKMRGWGAGGLSVVGAQAEEKARTNSNIFLKQTTQKCGARKTNTTLTFPVGGGGRKTDTKYSDNNIFRWGNWIRKMSEQAFQIENDSKNINVSLPPIFWLFTSKKTIALKRRENH